MSHKESAPGYRDVAVQISPTARIINCKDNIQWIIQKLKGGTWRSLNFWTWRDTMIAHLEVRADYWGETDFALADETRKALEALPDRHGRGRQSSPTNGGTIGGNISYPLGPLKEPQVSSTGLSE